VTATQTFYSIPYVVSTVYVTATDVIIPMVTPLSGGLLETNYVTETSIFGPTPPPVTWEIYSSVTLTFPTTYVGIFGLSGGSSLSTSITPLALAQCAYASSALGLPSDSITGLVAAVPTDISVVPGATNAVSIPQPINTFVGNYAQQQLGVPDAASCVVSVVVSPPVAQTIPGATGAAGVASSLLLTSAASAAQVAGVAPTTLAGVVPSTVAGVAPTTLAGVAPSTLAGVAPIETLTPATSLGAPPPAAPGAPPLLAPPPVAVSLVSVIAL
jgi:hypothetical protein